MARCGARLPPSRPAVRDTHSVLPHGRNRRSPCGKRALERIQLRQGTRTVRSGDGGGADTEETGRLHRMPPRDHSSSGGGGGRWIAVVEELQVMPHVSSLPLFSVHQKKLFRIPTRSSTPTAATDVCSQATTGGTGGDPSIPFMKAPHTLPQKRLFSIYERLVPSHQTAPPPTHTALTP